MATIAIIQARLGSTRLPQKVLLPLTPGHTALSCELARVKQAKLIDKILVATTTSPADQKLIEYLDAIGQEYFAGSEDDVLDRYYNAALDFEAKASDTIVRLTADCPVIDPKIIDQVVGIYLHGGFDFVSNSLQPYSYPDGMDVEVFSFRSLEKAWREAVLPSHREHVTFYFWQNPKLFKIYYHKNSTDLSKFRLTLDYPQDYELLKKVVEHFAQRLDCRMDEIITFLDQHPEIKQINANLVQNAGWQSSLSEDQKFINHSK